MTDEYYEKMQKAKALLKQWTVPGNPLQLVEGAPPEAEEALAFRLEWLRMNSICLPEE